MPVFPTPGEVSLNIVNPIGDVTVEASERDTTEVIVGGGSTSADRFTIDHREQGGRHHVTVTALRVRRRLLGLLTESVDIFVRLPIGAQVSVLSASAEIDVSGDVGVVDLKTASGDVRVEHCLGGKVTSVSGAVDIDRIEGDCTLQSVSGDVRLRRLEGDLTARTVSGEVQVNIAVEGVLSVRTVSGDVGIGVCRGSQVLVDAGSTSGDLSSEVDLSSKPDSFPTDGPMVELQVQTLSGDVRVTRAGRDTGAA